MTDYRSIALTNKAWPFEEARKLLARHAKAPPASGVVLFETGYGPSGLPHIGTFGEVARTSMVRKAYELISDVPTRLLCFSDDMDGLRKVPDNVPNQAMLAAHLGKPLTRVPDPFGKFDSFAAHNNAMLRDFLDRFGFDYEFASSTDYYRSGRFDATLLKMLAAYDDVMAIILPTLGAERRETWSPFLPLCPKTGVVLQVPMIARDAKAGTVTYVDPADGEQMTVAVTGGACKLQWKADWALRWVALGVDYEMAGKDLIDSVTLSGKITRALGARPPEGFNYELFLDEEGHKISKSKGNGLTIDEWLTYASPRSLSLYMYQNPRAAKRLSFDVIPKAVEEYYSFCGAFAAQPPEQQLGNPAFHIHGGPPPVHDLPLSFALLLNLVSVANSDKADVLWGFISQYAPGASAQTHPELASLVDYALRYYKDRVAPHARRRAPTDVERGAMQALRDQLAASPARDGETLQNIVYEIGKTHGFEPLRSWFACLYECLFGQPQGPRMGTFFALYGVENSLALLDDALRMKESVS